MFEFQANPTPTDVKWIVVAPKKNQGTHKIICYNIGYRWSDIGEGGQKKYKFL